MVSAIALLNLAMRPKSLGTTLLLTSLLWSALALVATAIVLGSAVRDTMERRFDETLSSYLSVLVAQLAAADGNIADANLTVGEPRFRLPLSGWYWVVETEDGAELLSSRSLEGDFLPLPAALLVMPRGLQDRRRMLGPAGQSIRMISQMVALPNGTWLRVGVTGDAAVIEADAARFDQQLAVFLTIFAGFLIAATFLQWRLTLRPLRRLERQIEQVREGRARRVSEDYPSEIQPMAAALNTLVQANATTIERARQHVGNLAHALKTPLSVLRNEAAANSHLSGKIVLEQTDAMQRNVRLYLERAQMAARDRAIGTVTETEPVLAGLQRAMAKIAAHRGISVELDAVPVAFAGERQDFEEIVGNLAENAVKWARTRVLIGVVVHSPAGNRNRRLILTVDDDGAGLAPEARQRARARGQRLDTSTPGTGLGLAIVDELVEIYGGTLVLADSPIGGLQARVDLPAI